LYDSGWDALYTCGGGELCVWDESVPIPVKLASVRFARVADLGEAGLDQAVLPDAGKHDTLPALVPYRMFPNKERSATALFVRSKLVDSDGEKPAGLEMLTVIDLRAMAVVHSEVCHPDRMTPLDDGEVARVLTLVGISADGSLAAFSHDDQWSGDGLLELWDIEEPASFTKHFIATLASGEAGLRGDGNALVYWSGSHKQGDDWLDDFKEYLIDWKYRMPADPDWEMQEPLFVIRRRVEREKQEKSRRRAEEERRREEKRLEEERHREEERRQEEERCQEEERRLERERKKTLEYEHLQREYDEVNEQVASGRRQRAEKQREFDGLGFFKGKEKRRLMAEIAEIDDRIASAEARRVELMLQIRNLDSQ